MVKFAYDGDSCDNPETLRKNDCHPTVIDHRILLADHNAVVAEKDKAYHELMQQAVRFADQVAQMDDDFWSTCIDAKAFLARPDVVAFKKQQEGTR